MQKPMKSVAFAFLLYSRRFQKNKPLYNIPLRVYDVIQSYKVMYNIGIITEVVYSGI
ncbi:hypothetical protein BW1_055_00420 [Bacillus mycoides NBRC 101238 = DSM 11821]|nr:hypothetical protein BW1_055_00420 [Bacillus mycoides NBRC 101238 = DSM 11821]